MLKRTGFKAKRPQRPQENEEERAARLECKALTAMKSVAPRAASMTGTTAAPVPKRTYVRSPALLAAVRQLECMHTGRPGPSDPAHSNWSEHGKGKGIKADDNRVAALCREVHRELDQGKKWSEAERRAIWWDAHVKTVRELLARGMWPSNVPVPDIRNFQ